MNFEKFLNFYNANKEILLYQDGLRPAKSITRNILNSVEKFVSWYKKYNEATLTWNIIANNICELSESGSSTVSDNIRNLKEIQFLVDYNCNNNNCYKFTRNFVDYVYSNLSLSDYIYEQMSKIDSLENINMFYNYILATLREGIIKGYITLYPDSSEKFKNALPGENERVKICQEVYELYGFKGRAHNPKNGDYTPNINYRIISTCIELGLIDKIENDEHGFEKYVLTGKGYSLLKIIDKNIGNYQKNIEVGKNNAVDVTDNLTPLNKNSILEDIYDELYIAESNNVSPDKIVNLLDLPQPIANEYARNTNRRDPQKAANAKRNANYKCVYNIDHISFTTKNNNENYVEAHHLVPMQLQQKFLYSLDIEANIVALCPICHRLIHHATNNEKKMLITKLYNERIKRLKDCNIYIELDDLLNFYYNN
jgi:hypothetical protein